MSRIIAIANQKGGVGKTTTAMNVAAGLVKVGKKVLAIDFDPQANLTKYLGHQKDDRPTVNELLFSAVNGKPINIRDAIRVNQENIHYIPSNVLLAGAELYLATAFCRENVLRKILRCEELAEYEYIIIDCLPSLGVMLTNALVACTDILVPVQSQPFALDGIEQFINVYKMIKDNINPQVKIIGVLVTINDNTNLAQAVKAALEELFPGLVFDTIISRLVEAAESTAMQCSLVSIPGSRVGQQYMQLVQELLRR